VTLRIVVSLKSAASPVTVTVTVSSENVVAHARVAAETVAPPEVLGAGSVTAPARATAGTCGPTAERTVALVRTTPEMQGDTTGSVVAAERTAGSAVIVRTGTWKVVAPARVAGVAVALTVL
jgi:hypothetical protein